MGNRTLRYAADVTSKRVAPKIFPTSSTHVVERMNGDIYQGCMLIFALSDSSGAGILH